jgi:hypothetical protein
LFVYSFTPPSRIFHLYGDVTITGKGLQNLVLYSALRAFEQRGIFIMLRHRASVFFRSYPKDRLIKSPLTPHNGSTCGGSIVTRTLKNCHKNISISKYHYYTCTQHKCYQENLFPSSVYIFEQKKIVDKEKMILSSYHMWQAQFYVNHSPAVMS